MWKDTGKTLFSIDIKSTVISIKYTNYNNTSFLNDKIVKQRL